MGIVGGIDIHRRQLTFDFVDLTTGENARGRISPADRLELRHFLDPIAGGGDVAMEGCTGWRYVSEELERAGFRAHVADPAETAARRGNKRRAKTDRSDAAHLRRLLTAGELPESWIPPLHVLEARTLVRLYKDLTDQRAAWTHRLQATLYHQGIPQLACPAASEQARALIAEAELSQAGRRAVEVALAQMDVANEMIAPLELNLARVSRHQPGCQALTAHYGVGPVTSVTIWSEMGDARRFSSSSDAVRHAGLDVTVYSSDTARAKGHLARQGPSRLRWALYEAAMSSTKKASPDHEYFLSLRERLGTQRAVLAVARKLARWCHHARRAAGDGAWAEAA
jgi:transposase